MRHRMFKTLTAVFALAVLAWPPAGPAAAAETDDDAAVAAWSVARLRVEEGSAWLLPPGESQWEEFEGNVPVSAGTRIRVAEDSSSVVAFDGGGRVRLREGADLEVRALREERVSLALHEGRADFRIEDDPFLVPFNVVLPDGQVVRFAEPGRYRVQAAGPGETSSVQVFKGEARIKVGDGKYRVREGEEARVGEGVSIGVLRDTDDPGEPSYGGGALSDAEREAAAPPSVVYELRDYGDWVVVPSYGAVWRPRVAVGWSPYFYGRWVWYASFGWSWVSVEPWGWYPYRTGYWFNDPGYGWCWTPYRSFASVTWRSGHRYYRPVGYYPSTVRFVRESGGFRWIPLNPGERIRRPEIPRTDRNVAGWWKPVPRGTVFERVPAREGAREGFQWRDARVEREARRPATRPAPVFRPSRPGTTGERTLPSVRPGTQPRQPEVRTAPGERTPRVRPMPAPGKAPDGGRPTDGRIWKRLEPERGGGSVERGKEREAPVRVRPDAGPTGRGSRDEGTIRESPRTAPGGRGTREIAPPSVGNAPTLPRAAEPQERLRRESPSPREEQGGGRAPSEDRGERGQGGDRGGRGGR